MPHWSAVDVHLVRTLVAERHRDGLAGRSLQRLLSALRTLYDYLLREGLTSANPALSVRAPRTRRRLPETLDADQSYNFV